MRNECGMEEIAGLPGWGKADIIGSVGDSGILTTNEGGNRKIF
jgi:hypothetical protein